MPGLAAGEISAHFEQIDGASVSKETISRITGKVIEEMTDWQNRALGSGLVSRGRRESALFLAGAIVA